MIHSLIFLLSDLMVNICATALAVLLQPLLYCRYSLVLANMHNVHPGIAAEAWALSDFKVGRCATSLMVWVQPLLWCHYSLMQQTATVWCYSLDRATTAIGTR